MFKIGEKVRIKNMPKCTGLNGVTGKILRPIVPEYGRYRVLLAQRCNGGCNISPQCIGYSSCYFGLSELDPIY